MTRGTINVVFANANGIVALTDSKITVQISPFMSQPSLIPGQKLFQLDDVTVCTFAGFASARVEQFPELASNSAGILQDFRRILARNPGQSFHAKLWALSSIFQSRLEAIANIRDLPVFKPEVELTLAGYDTDGRAKIGQVALSLIVENNANGHSVVYAQETDFSEETVGKTLVWKLGGIKEFALPVLSHPEEFAREDPAIADFAKAYAANRGASFTVEQMKRLAIALARHTAERDQGVGGDNQIATLENGRVTRVQQALFPEQQPAMQFGMLVGVACAQSNSCATGEGILFIKGKFDDVKQTVLDDNYFFSNEFVRSGIMYDGGMTRFDKTNKVGPGCTLFLGPHADRHPDILKHLRDDFSWKEIRPLP
jgi:20S proteasome alpha/beta subunit